ncbi:TPA: RHS domain-containing protein [Pluralibacter gergoviae]|nr:Rhs-family protein [Pluralibacter gergoviae]HDS1235307.1 RHS domain-containing protein [Pluralibacter gergoviae]HDS1241294.1 RHS domain-containing protein [Pluralibacter gergoviae]HDS1246514.1 RHS domain-containing protein [Pluralibacter gergoviae]HDS1251847.1 RHS domain-containing protein [Pluralibacter gergoviae]
MLWQTFRYTGRGELESVHDALRGDIHYGYDPEGRLLQHLEPQQNPLANRLQYDMADNLLDEPPVPVVSNRLPHWQRLFFHYDAWGNLVSRRSALNEQQYVYDANNRLLRASGHGPQGGFSAQYHYDALGRRTRKTVAYKGKRPQTTRFLWQGYRLLQEQRDNGTRRSWSYDPASPWTPLAAIEQADGGPQADIYWLHADLNSAPLEVTDADGHLRWSGQYDTFGRLKGQTTGSMALREGATYDQPLRYAGQYEDNESGLHYNLFRYYDPEVGRFTVQDPIGLEGGLNFYSYAPNPLGWIDPLGLSCASSPKAYSTAYEMRLSKTSYPGVSRGRHFQEANESLLKAMESDKQFAHMMKDLGVNLERTPTGLAPRQPPTNWTWHHELEEGVMRLVPRSQHTPGSEFWKILHPDGYGGYAVWGK